MNNLAHTLRVRAQGLRQAYKMDKIPDLIDAGADKIEEQEKRIRELEAGLARSEQTIRNLGNGFLTGDGKTIALNEAANITTLLGGAK